MKIDRIFRSLKFPLRALALAVAAFGTVASAQIYSGRPSWMPMMMLNVSFDSGPRRLDVVDQAVLAVQKGVSVYAGLKYAPPGTYDPSQPWAVLNGAQYSRFLGWDDASRINNTDPSLLLTNVIRSAYGSDAGIWIECLSRSAGLECYLAVGRYGVNANNTMTVDPLLDAYSGIFGTGGSSAKWQWDGKMDHNTYAVNQSCITAPGQLFSATYKVFVGDALGNEILNPDLSSASTIETWTWQAVVPEPSAFSLAVLGLAGLVVSRRKKA